MDPQHWKKVKSILERALEIQPDLRKSFLDSEVRDVDIRLEVESLLAFDTDENDALERPAVEAVIPTHFPFDESSYIGEIVGKYRVVREIGSGGMGTVYLAERADGEFEQRAAIKLIKSGVRSKAVLKRFLNERRMLASLEHPNIARIIDGGTTDDGFPYFVMEYVEGGSILEYSLGHGLDVSSRLDLFLEVCSAVSVAHQNLIIHRDLKPTNILVGKDGKPKLLDFGIAKLIRADVEGSTHTRHFAFTPEYASPEQIRGEHLTTSTDVYSLGVILYELLTGSRPFSFEGQGIGQIVSTVTQSQPSRPSLAAKRVEDRKKLAGDLDNIILKCLNKEPERRYSTVQELTEDIRRHLKGLPVRARRDTAAYRTTKFIRRNPLVAGFAALTFITLAGGIVATTYLARQAEAERSRAEHRFNDVRTLANSLIFEINDKIHESPIKARELLVSRSIEYLDKLAAEAEGDADLQAELAAAYEKIGDVQATYFGSGTGDTAEAIENHEKALKIRESLLAGFPDNVQYALDLASSQLRIADLSVTVGRSDFALDYYDRAVGLIEKVWQRTPEDGQVRRALARAYGKLGQGILRSGAAADALEKYERAIAIMSELSNENPADNGLRHSVSVYESYAGYAKLEIGRDEEAYQNFERALIIDREILRSDPENLEYRRNLSTAELWAGVALRSLRRFDASLEHMDLALEMQREIYDLDRSNLGDVNSLADCHLEIGWALSEHGKLKLSVDHFEKAIALYESVSKTDVNNLSARRQIAFIRVKLGDSLAASGNRTGARDMYKTALDELDKLVQTDGTNSEFRHDKAVCLIRLAELDHGSPAILQTAIEILERLVAESPRRKQRKADLERARTLLAQHT